MGGLSKTLNRAAKTLNRAAILSSLAISAISYGCGSKYNVSRRLSPVSYQETNYINNYAVAGRVINRGKKQSVRALTNRLWSEFIEKQNIPLVKTVKKTYNDVKGFIEYPFRLIPPQWETRTTIRVSPRRQSFKLSKEYGRNKIELELKNNRKSGLELGLFYSLDF